MVVVFFGISLSHWAENLRQDLADRELEEKYLHGLRIDLKKDLEELSRYRSIRVGQIKAAQANLRAFRGEPVKPDSFLANFVATSMEHHFSPNVNTYKEIINSGHFRLLTNVSLKAEFFSLMNLYDQLNKMDFYLQRDWCSFKYEKIFGTIDLEEVIGFFPGGSPTPAVAHLQSDIPALVRN